ncbi:hypothetical protein SLEP1_g14624 [Rubroshorea leprosula]|uniref:BTB/POZ and TAZ domain-containing protein 3-like n=1 Tax=Rubroshorea leprosula TaxID=152421 RepID=A0AAV5ITP9_9ROSI|nr:hypothetical protein SLEP1_g14624 [Rubroshorea leprosula]
MSCKSYNTHIEESNPATVLTLLGDLASSVSSNSNIPKPPQLPSKMYRRSKHPSRPPECSFVLKETKDIWDKLFKEGHGADVFIITDDQSYLLAHSSVLSAASPVLHNIIQQSIVKDGMKHIKIPGVHYESIYVFVRFLYSSCYEEQKMKKNVLHLLVLSHCYLVPSLKRVCIHLLEQGWLTQENVIDVLQLARSCDAPRLSFICVRMVVKDFRTISSTEGWKVMKHANPALEQELIESFVKADSRKQEKLRKMEEKKVYLELYEAMEALLHICQEGCRTIGPRDKVLKGSRVTCNYPACKGLEALVRHFSNCKTRVPGGCVHCKRMWQLFELHSQMCSEPDSCKVPLCRHFKEKMQQQSQKDEAKWRLLVSKVVNAKNALGPFSARPSKFIMTN